MDTATQTSAPSIATSPNTPAAEIKRIFDLQQANRQNVKNTTASQRRKKLKDFRKAIFARREDIRAALWADLHKAPAETDLVELYPTVTELNHAIDKVAEWMRPVAVETPLSHIGSTAKLVYEPKGVTLIIAPWNYPFQLSLIPLVSAIAAGNTAMIKPSEYTPKTNDIIKDIMGSLFSENEVAVIEGDYTVSGELLKLKFDHVFFTGSPNVGKIVMRAAADNLASVTLELGGKSPVIVDQSANVAKAAKRLVWGKCTNAGQTCIAPDYLYVHESKYDQLISELKKNIEAAYGKSEDEREQSEDYVHIINARHQGRLKKLLEDAIEKGANIEIGGKVNDATNYFAPTVLTNVTMDMEVMHEEIFGPILPVLKYNNLDEVLKTINDREKPLAMYIFSTTNSNINTLINNTSAGGTLVNDTLLHNSHPNLPFGGVNNSGIGSAHGLFGFKTFSHERGVMKQPSWFSAAEGMYPPYTNTVKKMIDFTLKYL